MMSHIVMASKLVLDEYNGKAATAATAKGPLRRKMPAVVA
jgi:hypothetical protein